MGNGRSSSIKKGTIICALFLFFPLLVLGQTPDPLLDFDNQDRQVLDVSGYSEFVDYVTEFREDYQWGRAVVRLPYMFHLQGLGLIVGLERTEDETQTLYGVTWSYGENRFLSTELSGDGDLKVKLYYGFNLNIGNEND